MATDQKAADVLAEGYSLRRPRIADAAAVQALIAASDLEEFGEAQGYSAEDIEHDWRDIDLERDAWLALAPDGAFAGYSYLGHRQHVRFDAEIYVHPRHFGKGIGTALIRLSEERADAVAGPMRPGERVTLNNWINARNVDACALLEREGYRPARYFWRMVADLVEEPSPAEWPDGFTVRGGAAGDELRVFHDVEEAAFADHWGHVPTPYEEWRERAMGPGFDPTLWFLASAGETPAGVVLCRINADMGWIGAVGVRAEWRQRGLGLALVRHAMGELYRRGMRRVGLSVDAESPTGATRLYERAGMHADQHYAGYAKELRSVMG